MVVNLSWLGDEGSEAGVGDGGGLQGVEGRWRGHGVLGGRRRAPHILPFLQAPHSRPTATTSPHRSRIRIPTFKFGKSEKKEAYAQNLNMKKVKKSKKKI